MTHTVFLPDFLQISRVLPTVAVAPTLVHDAPSRAVDDAAAVAVVVAVGAVVVVAVDVAHAEHSMPAAFTAIPGLSACVPRPSDCPERLVWKDAIGDVPVADVARRLSVEPPTEVCTYVAIVPSGIRSPAGTPPVLFDTTALKT